MRTMLTFYGGLAAVAIMAPAVASDFWARSRAGLRAFVGCSA